VSLLSKLGATVMTEEQSKAWSDKPIRPGMTLTNAEADAIAGITPAWDRVTKFLMQADFAKAAVILAKFLEPCNTPESFGGELGPAMTRLRIAEAGVLDRASLELRELAKTCPCENCEKKRASEPAPPVKVPLINGSTIAGTDAGGLMSSARVAYDAAHDRVTVFNRGANAGHLTVKKGDGERLARRIVGGLEQVLEEHETLAQMRDLIMQLATQSVDTEKLLAIEADAAKLAQDAGWLR